MRSQIVSVVGILVLAFFTGIEAQIGAPCHASFFQFTARHSLNISSYVGSWYLHEIAGSHIGNFPPPDYKCSKRVLSLPDPDDLLHISAEDSFINNTDGLHRQIMSSINVNASRSPLSSMWSLTDEEGVTAQVIILSADLEFQQWTVVYSCSILAPNYYRYEVVMAMTRSRTITPELRQFLKALMVGQGFRIGDHHPVDQTGCPI